MTPTATDRRRWLAALAATPLLAACASAADEAAPAATAAPPGSPEPLLSRWRSVPGGFLSPPVPGAGLPARPGTGMFVRWVGTRAVALRGNDLLVLDAAAGRLWRADTALNTVAGIAGAPTLPDTVLALGPDGSAWVLDPGARQVLRFARDGRLLQTWRIGTALPSPVAMALADGGATLLLADGLGAQWAEQRSPSAPVLSILPAGEGGQRISGVDGLALGGAPGAAGLWVLDRLAGAVHRVQRDGRVQATLGRGALAQPSALAVDRFDRVYVVDRLGRSLVVLRDGAEPLALDSGALGVQQIGGLAVDDRLLAVSDALGGAVVLHRLGRPAAA